MMTHLGKNEILWRVLKALWLFACVLILVLTLTHRGPEYRDAGEAEELVMGGLSFPSGWLFAYLFFGTLIGGNQTTELQWIFIIWVPLFVLGYLQWFVLVPAIVRWWRKKFGGGGSGNISAVPKD